MMKYFASVGASLFFFFAIFFTVVWPIGGVAEAAPEEGSMVDAYITSGGLAGFLLIMLGMGCVGCSVMGAVAASKTLWRRLVRGLGEGAFLLGILGGFTGLRAAMNIVATLGAAVTPADLAHGIAQSVAPIVLGTVVALLALIGSGVIDATEKRAAATG